MNTKKEEKEDTKKKEKKKSTLKIHLKPPTGVLLGGVTDTLRSSVLMRSMTGQTTWVGSRAMRSSRGSIQPAGATLQISGIGDRESGIGGCWRWWDWDGTSRCAMGDVPILSCVCAIESYGWKCPINPLWVCLSGSCLTLSKKTWLSQRILVRGP